MSLPVDTEMVSAEQLLQYLGDLILSQDSTKHKVPYHLDVQHLLNVKYLYKVDFGFVSESFLANYLGCKKLH